jgi:2-dehydro-3-deoxy-L-rhamnonate dehydrogenase (NAD+)
MVPVSPGDAFEANIAGLGTPDSRSENSTADAKLKGISREACSIWESGSGEAAVNVFSGRFEGRTAVVTGAASGIGRDVARRLSAEGARVSMWDLNASALGAAAAEAGAPDKQAVDIAAEAAVDAAMSRSIDALGGRLDILVASAGITGPNGPLKDYTGNDWRKVFDVNVNGVFYCNRAAVRAMDSVGYGRIVNVASVAGKEGNPNASAYSASKAAVIALTKSLGKETAASGIRVNCITPAAIKTGSSIR